MARLNTGGKSVRIDFAVSPELYAAVEKYMDKHDLKASQVARLALATFVGKPELAEGMKPGRPWPKKTKRKPKKSR